MSDAPKFGYMCSTAFTCELGSTSVMIYSNLEELTLYNGACLNVVEVEV